MDVTLSKVITHNSDISFALVFGFRVGGSSTCDLYVCMIRCIIIVRSGSEWTSYIDKVGFFHCFSKTVSYQTKAKRMG